MEEVVQPKTSFGTTAEDIIRAGVSLPIGASPPRRVGVLVGDAECYTVFKELLEPIISHYHGIKSYEEWMDPELPMESHFKSNRDEDNRRNSKTISSKTAANDDYGIIKSGAGDANDDFILDEEEEDVYLLRLHLQHQMLQHLRHQNSKSQTFGGTVPSLTILIWSDAKPIPRASTFLALESV
ncbi:hypothetical protein QTG54_004822 [Skeletonema marinoi]|uniref:Phosphagen kinase N-terminal domain-containing protein n=1 Tax=Skeletonema marinoi TaxID=267567 RepID=A0AAD8YEW2_9STRA|nr:hypothetical protein QTG54_004822 [Skeletonema marinoi]